MEQTQQTQPQQTFGGTEQKNKNEDIIFASIFSNDEGVTRRRQELLTTFNTVNVFTNEYLVFFAITKEFSKIVPNKDFLQLFLQTNKASLSRSPYVDLTQFHNGDNDPYVEFVHSTLDLFQMLEKTHIEDMDYFRAIGMHKMEYVNKQSIELLEESTIILSEGISKGRKQLSGYEDMRKHIKQGFLDLDNMMNKSDRRGIVTYGTDENDEEDSDGSINIVTTFGIEGLDKALGGIYEGDMVSLLAPAKGGKTRFATFVLHNAIVNHGVNVGMWSVENGYKGWEALIRARHFNWFYNSKVTDASQKRYINADMIRKGELEGDLKQMEQASWADLRYNTAYGKMVSIDQDFDADNLIEVLENTINDYGVKLLCVDYLQLITGGDVRQSKNERIGEAYKKVLQLLKKKKVGGIFPGQLKQSVVGDIQRVNPEDLINMELRDSAGESYEVIKTPDVNLALYGTVEDIRNGQMKMLSIPSRNSAPFEPIDLYVDAGTCTFADITPRTA